MTWSDMPAPFALGDRLSLGHIRTRGLRCHRENDPVHALERWSFLTISQSGKALPEGKRGHRCPRRYVKLGEDVRQVARNSTLTDEQFRSYLLVRHPSSHEPHHLDLPITQSSGLAGPPKSYGGMAGIALRAEALEN